MHFDQGERDAGQNPLIARYRGVSIHRDPESGLYGEYGNESFGYADDIADIYAEIDDYLAGPDDARARQGMGWADRG